MLLWRYGLRETTSTAFDDHHQSKGVRTLVRQPETLFLSFSPQNNVGDTPLHVTSWKNHADIVQLLLTNGLCWRE